MTFLAILFLILLVVFAIVGPNYSETRSRNGGLVLLLILVVLGIKVFTTVLE